ncbi:MAG: ATP-binding protein [Roseiflexaceae bacterium]
MLTTYQPTKLSERFSYNPPWPALYINDEGVIVHATHGALSLFDMSYNQICEHPFQSIISSETHELRELMGQARIEQQAIRTASTIVIGTKRLECKILLRYFERVNLYLLVIAEQNDTNRKEIFDQTIEQFLAKIVGDTGLRNMIFQLQEHFAKINIGVIISLLQTPISAEESYPVMARDFAGLWVFGRQLAITGLPDPKVLSYVVNRSSAYQSFDDLSQIMSSEGEENLFKDLHHSFSITGIHKFIGIPLISNHRHLGFALIGGPFFDEYDITHILTSLHYLQGSIAQFHAQSYLATQITRLERLNYQINQLVNIQHEEQIFAEVCNACMAIFDTNHVLLALIHDDKLRLAHSSFIDTQYEIPYDAELQKLLANNFYTTTLADHSVQALKQIAAVTGDTVMVSVPIHSNQRVIGFIGIFHKLREILTDRDVIYARQFADFVSSHYARIRLTSALNESEQRYRFLLNETSFALLIADANFVVTHMNHAARRMIGIDDDNAFLLTSVLAESENPPSSTWSEYSTQLNAMLVDQVLYQTGIINRIRNTIIPVELEAKIFRQDTQIEYVITLRDIQERIAIEQQFQLRERELDLFQHITSVVNSSLNLDELLNRSLDILDVAEFGSMTAIILLNEQGQPYIAAHRRVPPMIIAASKTNPHLLWSAFDQILPDAEKGIIPTNLPLDSVLTNQIMIYIGHIIGSKLTADEKIIGLILASHMYKSQSNFTPRDLQILNAVSNQLSRAVTNAKLHSSLQHAADRYISLYEEAETIRANLALIINSSPDVLILVNRHTWHMRVLNEQPLAALQYVITELNGKPFHVLCSADTQDVMYKHYNAIKENSTYNFEMELLRGDGQTFNALVATNDMNNDERLFVIKDITPMRQLENRIKQREKLALIGQMIASVAHELNNPIGVIRGIAQLQLLNKHDPQLQNDFEVIEQTSQRAGRIVQQLRSLLQPQQFPTSKVNLYQCMMRIIAPYINSSHAHQIEFDFPVVPDDYLVIGVESQLEQVFINLIDNAIRAMQQIDTERKLTISMHKRAQKIIVNIDDSGPGIAPHVRKTIFEPFVTTRSVGDGMGLGLAIVHAIVMQHHGKIEHYGVLPRGTRFTLTLPSADAPRIRVAKHTRDNDLYTNITEILRELSATPLIEVNNYNDAHDLLIIDEVNLHTIPQQLRGQTPLCVISSSGKHDADQTSVIITPLMSAEQIRQQISTLIPHIVV